MITRRFGFKHAPAGAYGWQTTRGAAYYAGTPGAPAAPPGGALHRPGAAPRFAPARPNLMMDPSDPTTWQRSYRFTI